jgi:SagB-type dehydrogenase family enzyme
MLPEPRLESEVSLEETLLERRSVREYADLPLSLEDVSQLLWAAQGITSDWGGRTAPSAGALYPLEVYLVVGDVENLEAGIYKYQSEEHALVRVGDSDVRSELASAALSQSFVEEGAIDIVIAAIYERTTRKYGERGVRYVHMEAGHAAQNIYLEAVALDLGTVTIGAFFDEQVKDVLGMPESEVPLYIMPVGKKQA